MAEKQGMHMSAVVSLQASLWQLLVLHRHKIFNVLVPAAFISYALLDHGLGRTFLWGYVLLLITFWPIYNECIKWYRDRLWNGSLSSTRTRHPRTHSHPQVARRSVTFINEVFGQAVFWSFVLLVVGMMMFFVAAYLTVFVLLILGLVGASFDFLWDWHVDLGSYAEWAIQNGVTTAFWEVLRVLTPPF